MKVIFKASFDWRPRRQVVITFKPGPDPQTVKRECGEQAIAQGKAVSAESEPPSAEQ